MNHHITTTKIELYMKRNIITTQIFQRNYNIVNTTEKASSIEIILVKNDQIPLNIDIYVTSVNYFVLQVQHSVSC